MKRFCSLAVLAVLVAGFAACGSSSSTTPDITSLDQMPRATGPVVDSTTGNIATPPTKALAKATTGVVMGTLSNSTFSQGNSMSLCEAANHVREVLNGAAQADLILCYLQTMVAGDTTLSAIYDGSYHIAALNITGADQGSPDQVKMKITKTGNIITGFEMFACRSGSQMEYLNQTITGTAISMTSKGNFQDSWHEFSLTGNLNTSGYYTSKVMTMANTSSTEGNECWNEATVTQYTDKMVYDGYDSGNFTDTEHGVSGTFTNRVYSQAQLIDPNTSAANASYDIRTIALGDGAANSILRSQSAQFDYNPGAQAIGWNGDTKLDDNAVAVPNSTTTWLSLVETATPTAANASAPTVAFAADETYDCAGTAEVTISADETAMGVACGKYSLGHSWINCYGVIQPTQP